MTLDHLQIPRSSGRGALILSGLAVCFDLDRVMSTSGIGTFRTFATDLAMAVYGVKADLTDAVPAVHGLATPRAGMTSYRAPRGTRAKNGIDAATARRGGRN